MRHAFNYRPSGAVTKIRLPLQVVDTQRVLYAKVKKQPPDLTAREF